MSRLISFLIVSLLFINLADGAQTQSDNCSWWKYTRDFLKCSPELLYFVVDMSKMDFTKENLMDSELDELQLMCAPVRRCLAAAECLGTELQKTIKEMCEEVVYQKSSELETYDAIIINSKSQSYSMDP